MPWWVWLLVVLAIVAAAAALWYFYLRPQDTTSTAGDVFIGNWAPEAGTGGGLVIKQSGDQFKITQYDPQLQQAGSTNADLVDDALEVSRQGVRARPHRRHRQRQGHAHARQRERHA